ncbi:MAG: LysE family transporter [Acidobacteriota bacterium]
MLSYFTMGLTFAFAAAIQPGPFLAYLISQTLSNGFRRTWPSAFAPLLSDVPIALVALTLLSLAPPYLLGVLQCAGGLFLLYLATAAFKAWRNFDRRATPKPAGTVLKAAGVNLLNPNPYLGWALVTGPLLLKAWHEAPAAAIALLIGFYGTMIGTTLVVLLLFASAAGLGERANRLLVGLSALGLGTFAAYELWAGARAL